MTQKIALVGSSLVLVNVPHPDEEAFQAAIDASNTENTNRLVFADWLDEHDDIRGPGYRAMGLTERYTWSKTGGFCWWDVGRFDHGVRYFYINPDDPIPSAYIGELHHDWFGNINWEADYGFSRKKFDTRREADDAAAIAFSKLTKGRQEWFLKIT